MSPRETPSTTPQKIVVIGGTGLIGTKLVGHLRRAGHEVLAVSPRTGVDTLTGAGLAEALAGARIVVDVSNSPSFEDRAVLAFFETSGRKLAAAERAAGVAHHVALSVVGLERLPGNGYFRAKLAQEALIRASGIAYTIVRSTQFFEFIGAIAEYGAESGPAGNGVRVSPALLQPIASDDVALAMAEATLAATRATAAGGMVEIAGPEKIALPELVRQLFAVNGDSRPVRADPEASYFGDKLDDHSLTAGSNARLGAIHFKQWLSSLPAAAAA